MLLYGFECAKRVVGIDINEDAIAFAKSKRQSYSDIEGILEFKLPSEMATEKFNLVLSKDSFEHYDNPEDFIVTLEQYLKPNGQLVIGFSPLWKSPYGGHINDLTRLPWVHLLFPEPVLLLELRRFLKDENNKSFKQIAGGLNKMTLKRYLKIVQDRGFEFEFFKTNVSSNLKERSLLRIFRILCLIPPIREYFTVNLYSILHIKDRPSLSFQ
jgi:SAM-dependent methyltransferase